MLNLKHSLQNKGLLVESGQVTLSDYIIDLAWSPATSQLAAVTVEGSVYLIEDHGDSVDCKHLGKHAGGGNSLSWRVDGAEFATAGQDGLAKVWDGRTGQQLGSLDAGDPWVAKVAYSPRRNVLATAAGRHLRLWNEHRQRLYESSDHASTIADLGWEPGGSGVAAAAYNGITLHAPGRESEPRKYAWKGSSLVLSWSPDSKYIATGEQDSTVHFWRVKSGEDAQMWGFPTKVLELTWDSTGQWLATGGGPSICLWNCGGKGPAGRKPRQLEAHTNKLTQIAFQPDGDMLASADADAFLYLWDPLRHRNVLAGLSLSSSATCLRWRAEGRLAVGQRDGSVVLFGLRPVAKGGNR